MSTALLEQESNAIYETTQRTVHGLGDMVEAVLFENPDLDVKQIFQEATREMNKYIDWTWVRMKRAPVALGGPMQLPSVGCEGLVAGVWNADQYIAHGLTIGNNFLTNLLRQHPHDMRFRKRLDAFLYDGHISFPVARDMHELLSMELAKLRVLARNTMNPIIIDANEQFRRKTMLETSCIPAELSFEALENHDLVISFPKPKTHYADLTSATPDGWRCFHRSAITTLPLVPVLLRHVPGW